MRLVDVVELEPAVIQVAGLCSPVNRNVLANPKVHIHIGDAREFVLTSRDQYDLIASEPSNPYRAGVASLFTREFYQAAAKRLRPGGLFVQWVQAYEVNGSAISTIYATIASVFPGVETWRSQSGDMLLIGTRQPLVYDVASLRRKIQEEPFRSALASVWRVTDLEGVLARHLGNSGLARAVAARQRAVNTDDRNRLEYAFASTVGSSTSFSLEQLAHICREEGFNQPALSGGAINGEAVADRGASAQIVDGGSEALSFDSPGFRSRTAAKTAFLRGDLGLVLKHWFDQTQPPGDLVELLMVASSLAAQGDDRAPAYIERLRAWFPSEADAVMARYLCRKGRVNEGMELFEKAFLAWRDDPWPAPKLIRSSMSGAVSLALTSHDAGLALRLQQALQVPFAVHILEGERLENLLKLARRLDAGGAPRNIRALISSWEPDVPWTIDFLNVRASCYTLTGDSRAAAARGDLEDFKRSEGEPLAYARRGETNSAPEGGFTEGLVSTLGWLKVRASGK